jgi:hypothetical protein
MLSACTSVQVPDVKIYAVAGRLQAGMDWAATGHEETGEITMGETIKFLEAGALCMSSPDYMRLKTAVEQLCYTAGGQCSYEVLKKTTDRISAMQNRAKYKPQALPFDVPLTH